MFFQLSFQILQKFDFIIMGNFRFRYRKVFFPTEFEKILNVWINLDLEICISLHFRTKSSSSGIT